MVALDVISAINARRKELNYSVNRLARNVEVNRSTLSKYLSMKTSMPLGVALACMHWLGIDVAIIWKADNND